MGVVLSKAQRALRRFNIENRAHKIISKDKPTPAPRHPSTVEALEKIAKENPEIFKTDVSKQHELDNRLKQIYVVSEDKQPEDIKSTRTLPQLRRPVESPEFGFEEPTMIPQGRFSLRQAIQFITKHQENPETWNANDLAKEYGIDQTKMEKILLYYKTFELYIPENKDGKRKENILAEPVKSRGTELEKKGTS